MIEQKRSFDLTSEAHSTIFKELCNPTEMDEDSEDFASIIKLINFEKIKMNDPLVKPELFEKFEKKFYEKISTKLFGERYISKQQEHSGLVR